MKTRTTLPLLFALFCGTLSLLAQSNKPLSLNVSKTQETLEIDGKLNEAIWRTADKTSSFIQNFPTDSLLATSQTEVMVTFNDQFLYVGGTCYENSEKEHIIQSLKRDFNWPLNENLGVFFDTFNDKSTGFNFGITPAGVQREGLVTSGSERSVSTDWDCKWYSAVHDYGDKWTFEMAIPFKSIRYNHTSKSWNMILVRLDLKNNERSTWAPVPQGFRMSSFNFAGKLNFMDDLPKSGTNISFIPFISGSTGQNFEDNELQETTGAVGFDAKIGLTSSLNLDLTVNPDFSQVDVDEQVTNLDRFEIFFPEKRQFFLENSDLFAQNGFPPARPFFSRRIGIASSDLTINGLDSTRNGQVPILYGARLSGKLGNNWRIGALNMLTRASEDLGLPQQMYSVGVVERKLFASSRVGLVVVNKKSLGVNLSDTSKYYFNESIFDVKDSYIGEDSIRLNISNTVLGGDFNFRSSDNKFESNVFYHSSLTSGKSNYEYAYGAYVGYILRRLKLRVYTVGVSEDYNAEVGFVQRNSVRTMGTFSEFAFYPKNSSINNHGPGINASVTTDLAMNITDYAISIGYQLKFLNTMSIEASFDRIYQKLRNNFDPTRSDGFELLEGEAHDWNAFSFNFNTDTRRLVSFRGGMSYGGFYNGNRLNIKGQLQYRYQPYMSIGLRGDYNDIELPEPYNNAKYLLLGPRIDLTFTDKLFFTTFVQYNEQADNVNINARFQWRYKPASDLFIVYTDNYLPAPWNVKNRALVLKLNYWLNI